jgi:hypothetical protein
MMQLDNNDDDDETLKTDIVCKLMMTTEKNRQQKVEGEERGDKAIVGLDVSESHNAVSNELLGTTASKMKKLLLQLNDLQNKGDVQGGCGLTEYTLHQLYDKAEELFMMLCQVYENHIIFSEVDRRALGPLLRTSLPALVLRVQEDGKYFTDKRLTHACKVRSGLQFLLDDYGDFPAESHHDEGDGREKETLAKALSEHLQHMDLVEYDGQFIRLKHRASYHYRSRGHDKMVQRMPEHHIWWKMVSPRTYLFNANTML